MRTDELDFYLPPELIAQEPVADRSRSRLLHYKRADGSITHRTFGELPAVLGPDDTVVFNNARVLPARFLLRKSTGGGVEGLFLSEAGPGRWRVLLRNLGRRAGEMSFDGELAIKAKVVTPGIEGEYEIELSTTEAASAVLGRVGRMPLPPYIKREKGSDARDGADRSDYQTVYAAVPGSVAAPTAGLHFTPELLDQLVARGIRRVDVTLHVGIGTFKPVKVDELAGHPMHRENYEIDAGAAELLNATGRAGGRIVAIGTTAARTLESWPAGEPWRAATGSTDIFIYPPYAWKRVGALVTNFHLPRSTLVALVAAMVGLEQQRRIYQVAVEQRYRFFSYGDAMLIE